MLVVILGSVMGKNVPMVGNRCWTAERLARRGLQHPETCPLYHQEQETIQHTLAQCVVAREVWFLALEQVGLQQVAPVWETGFQQWLLDSQGRIPREKRKGYNMLVILVAWCISKQQSRCVFDNAQPSPRFILHTVSFSTFDNAQHNLTFFPCRV